MALCLARICNSPDAKTQLNRLLLCDGEGLVPNSNVGNADVDTWYGKFADVVPVSSLVKIKMDKINSQQG